MLFCRESSNRGIEPTSLLSYALTGEFFATVPPGKPWNIIYCHIFKYYYSYMDFYNNDILNIYIYIYIYIYICIIYIKFIIIYFGNIDRANN